MARIFAFMTGERVTEESAAFGNFAELGWVDPSYSRRVLHDSRNDVRPLVDCDETDPDLADYVREALAELGAYADNGDGTFYSADPEEDYQTGDTFTYAIHFVRKSGAAGNYSETAWHPETDGGISLAGSE